MKAIVNGKLIFEDKIIEDKVIIFNHRIVDIVNISEFNQNISDIEVIDAKGNLVSPGFIDLHIHGSSGFDIMDGTDEAIENISRTISKNGVTSFLATTMTMQKDKIHKALNCIRDNMNGKIYGAKVLGAHLEGPFISSKYKGAQNEEFIIDPSFDFIKDYTDVIKIITIAPEMDKGFEFIRKIKNETDIVVSIGHSNADYNTALKAIENGASHITHLFNAMTPLSHRELGIVGAAMNSDVYCELITDKIHVHEDMFNIVKKLKNPDKLILVTDCMRAGCLKNGISELGGQKVRVFENCARLEDGTLAGSVLKLNQGVKNFKEHTDSTLCEVIKMVTINPAKDLSMDDEIGSIDINKKADLVIFDSDFSIIMTIVNGKIVYRA